ncbi:MAG: hypothetical protein ACEY3K_01110, partial [Wolbachia sp.]
ILLLTIAFLKNLIHHFHKKNVLTTCLLFLGKVRHLGTDAAHCYGGFLAVLSAWCEENNIPYQGVNVKTIKRFIAGNGNASKSEVIEAIREKGFFPKDDNEADALALMFYVMNLSKDFNTLKIP